jgi:citrate lyase subunit beta/citryl-CoA lyase
MKNGFRRSALFVPGDSEKMLQKSASVSSDILLLNLEDGVALSQKGEARAHVARALKNVDYGSREIVVRVNPLNTEIGQSDLSAIVACSPDGICLPKVETADEIKAADRSILELEISLGLPEGRTGLHAMIESARGLMCSFEIASASPRVASLIFGSADYAGDVRCRPGEDRFELLFALNMILTSARAAGIDAIDAPCFDIHNLDLLEREAVQARRLGFDGKSALHPGQLAIINRIFEVTDEEIAWAEKVLAELDGAETRGKALTTMEGKLIDNPHRAAAERILRRRHSC